MMRLTLTMTPLGLTSRERNLQLRHHLLATTRKSRNSTFYALISFSNRGVDSTDLETLSYEKGEAPAVSDCSGVVPSRG